jgi:pimeloyl-ACP methyl ester carboxylesterase/DNA-binding CsgD family transcriptional regulator
MDAPPVQYVKTNDGFDIAYAVSGEGPPFVFMPGVFEHVQLSWQFQPLRPWLEGLSARFRLVQFDPRGSGMSSRGLSADHRTEDYLLDLEAVMNRLGLGQFILLGGSTHAYTAIDFALKHPERVSALILGPVAFSQDEFKRVFFSELPAEDWDLFLKSLASNYRQLSEPAETVRLLKQSFDQRDYIIRMRAASSGLGEERLSSLRTPTLVLHARDYWNVSAADAMRVARSAGGAFSLIDGSYALGDAVQGIRAIEKFLSDVVQEEVSATHRETNLSAREAEVLRLLAAGKSNAQIADELVLSVNTVIRHVSNVFGKIGAANRAQATAYAKDHGLA